MVHSNIIPGHQITPIISITFYMVIIRVRLACHASQETRIPLEVTSTDNSLSADRRHRMQVHVTTLTESKVENGQFSSMSLTSPIICNHKRASEIKLGAV